MLTVLDAYTRQALAVTVRKKMGVDDVLEALYPLLLRHGTSEYIQSDNGPEFAAEATQAWLRSLILSQSVSILDRPKRTDTTSGLMPRCAKKFSM